MTGAFYVIDKDQIVRSSACGTEMQAKREAVQILGRIKFSSVLNLSDSNIEAIFRSLVGQGLASIQYSHRLQNKGKPFVAGRA